MSTYKKAKKAASKTHALEHAAPNSPSPSLLSTTTGTSDDTSPQPTVNASSSNEELMARIAKLESENEQLKTEREKNKLRFLVDVNDNLQKLQDNLRARFAKYSESLPELKMPNMRKIDIEPWVRAVAEARGVDVDVITKSLSVRKRQFLAVAVTFVMLPTSMLLSLLWLYLAIFHDPTHFLKTLLVLYALHIYTDKTFEYGSLLQWSWRKHWWWKLVRNYFPILLVKQNTETVYSPEKLYMFGYHPHGIISAGCFMSFAADATGVSKLIPGITIYPATLNANFYIPFWRELLLRLGVIGVSAKYLHNILEKGPGYAPLVVPGGAAEALDARPGTHTLILNRRQGFFRIALQHGASLVPIYSFGENDLYEQAPNDEGSLLRKVQTVFLKYAGFATPFFSGAGSMGASMPMSPIPARVPIITVIGDPIDTQLIENPTQADIDHLRVRYVEGLQAIFTKFADKYAPDRSADLHVN